MPFAFTVEAIAQFLTGAAKGVTSDLGAVSDGSTLSEPDRRLTTSVSGRMYALYNSGHLEAWGTLTASHTVHRRPPCLGVKHLFAGICMCTAQRNRARLRRS